MAYKTCAALFATIVIWSAPTVCAATDFSGHWHIDLRSPTERQRNAECGYAYFKLTQSNTTISGDHGFAAPGCGRINEGGGDVVKGVVVGSTAVLVVTSARNGAVVLGKATRKGSKLHWATLQEVRPGEPAGDSPLILGKGVLSLDRSASSRD